MQLFTFLLILFIYFFPVVGDKISSFNESLFSIIKLLMEILQTLEWRVVGGWGLMPGSAATACATGF